MTAVHGDDDLDEEKVVSLPAAWSSKPQAPKDKTEEQSRGVTAVFLLVSLDASMLGTTLTLKSL